MDDYEKFVAECKKIKKENRIVLDGFQNHLESKKLSDKTIDKHVSNMEYYINDFLLYEEPLKPRDGIYEINYFLGYWFIKKALWASVSTIKENITSLKHFYTYMNDIGQISAEELDDIKIEIKENKEEWLETIKKYDDPDVDFDDVW